MNAIKRILKLLLASILYYSGALSLLSYLKTTFVQGKYCSILMYHNVIADSDKRRADIQPGMCVTRSMFDKHMKFVSNHYNVISLMHLTELLKSNSPIPPKTVIITFDDGWRDNYDEAFPVLKIYNLPATIFLTTDLLQSQKLPVFLEANLLLSKADIWPRKAADIFRDVIREGNLSATTPELDEPRLRLMERDTFNFMKTLMLLDYRHIALVVEKMKKAANIDTAKWDNYRWFLNWDEIREMNRNNIDFGSHGQSHDLMIYLDRDQIRKELTESKTIIETNLRKPIYLFSYPNGDYNKDIKRLTSEAGYYSSTATDGRDPAEERFDMFALRRLGVAEGMAMGPKGRFSPSIFAFRLFQSMFSH